MIGEGDMNQKKVRIAGVNDLKDGEMKEFAIEDNKILLSKSGGKYYATGASCPHYGAPLEKGIFSGERIVCPWHHATYNAKNGDLLEPPSRNALASFEVEVKGEDVYVFIPEKFSGSRMPEMGKHEPGSDKRTFVIIGAGAAGSSAAETLRQNGFDGRIQMLTFEDRMPYDRPNLSKEYLQGDAKEEWMPLRPDDFYEKHGIEVLRKTEVTEIDKDKKELKLASGEALKYDKLLITTGGTPNSLDIPGMDLKNVFTLRTFDNSDEIIKAAEKSKQVAVIGASFIGMETAFSMLKRKLKVTVIAPESTPFEHIFGKEIGGFFQKKHEEAGTVLKLGNTVKSIEGKTKVEGVVLDNDEKVDADMVIVGIGVKPKTGFLNNLQLEKDGSLAVDEYFHYGDDIYAAGDIAQFPFWYSGEKIRIEHWRTSEQEGRHAGLNMAGKNEPFRSIPFFWTTQVGIHFRYVGYVREWDDLLVEGDISKGSFIAYFIKGGKVHAAAGIKYDKEMAAVEELMRRNQMPSPEELKGGSIDLIELAKI
jgi:NADPH-dependent 2,4-dienoyl-CoA reductase/sulfur reductase-like enzyme/nitrite reductase/ring-hydroxylating ferredoxin subunit